VDDNDPDQKKLPLDIEPIELARARYNLHVLGRVFVSGYRRFLKPHIVWLSLSVLSIAAGWTLIEYTSARSEHSFPRSSVISVAILYPEHDSEFYLDKISTFTVIPVNDGAHASLLITLAAKFDNPPVVLLSDTHHGDCVGSALTRRIDDIIGNVATLTAIRIAGIIGNVATVTKNVATDLFARDSTIYQLPLSAVSFTRKATSPPIGNIVLLCSNILRPNEVTFTERQMIFQYPFAPATIHFESKSYPPSRAPENYVIYKKVVIVAAPDLARYEGFRLTEARPLDKSEAGKLHIDIDAAREISTEYRSVVMTWHDTTSLLRRDTILLLVGAIFGLAGAFVVELIKGITANAGE
jgi:hypothetical protein